MDKGTGIIEGKNTGKQEKRVSTVLQMTDRRTGKKRIMCSVTNDRQTEQEK